MKRPRSGGKKKIISLRTIALALAALILGLSIYRWNSESLMGDKMPMPFGFGVSVILSGSMEPRLSMDDLVVIRETEEVREGDIVVFQEGNILIIHRVLEINGEEIITKGDANNMADAPIAMEDIKGVMVWDLPYAGILVRFLKQPAVIAVLLVTAVYLTNRSFRKEQEQDADELDEIKKEIEELMKDLKNQ